MVNIIDVNVANVGAIQKREGETASPCIRFGVVSKFKFVEPQNARYRGKKAALAAGIP